jgi:light-regulated signal transduction histidine kinase (bacteriophytochrome)
LKNSSKSTLLTRLSHNETLLEVGKKDKEFALMEQSLASQKNQSRFTLGLLILLAIVLAFMVHSYWVKKNFNAKLKQEVERQTSEILEKHIEIESFTKTASHDLKTPIRNITSFTSLLKRSLKDHPNENVHEYLGFVQQYAAQMSDLVEDISNFSKIRQTGEVKVSDVNLNDITDKIIHKTLKEKIETRKARVFTEGVLPTLKASEKHIEQLISNLLDNAMIYNEQDEPEITIGVEYNGNNESRIYVRDNGIGIDSEYQNKVFDMFTRLHSVKDYKGSGLGLATCKKIVNQYGGNIWLDSQKGKGTTVYFSLPAA